MEFVFVPFCRKMQKSYHSVKKYGQMKKHHLYSLIQVKFISTMYSEEWRCRDISSKFPNISNITTGQPAERNKGFYKFMIIGGETDPSFSHYRFDDICFYGYA